MPGSILLFNIASAVRSRGDLLCILLVLLLTYPNQGYADDTEWFTDAAQARPFKQRIDNLDDDRLDQFILGRSFFSIPWVVAPSATTARDGLGPLFNANTCTSCHVDNGAGDTLADNGQPLRALTFKLARPNLYGQRDDITRMNYGDPVYGTQIAINGNGNVAPEALTRLHQHSKTFTFPDGQTQTLTHFEPYLEQMNYGSLHQDTRFALRQAPPLVGLGLIARVSPETILAYADPDDTDGDGISGRPNRVYDIAGATMKLGKYGWKAGQPTVLQQTADAAANDMGLTNPLFPDELCTPTQRACLDAPIGRPSLFGTMDLPQPRLEAIASYVQSFKAPRPASLTPQAQLGQKLFTQIGCASCHRAQLTTHDGVTFAPYSDFLLHDMGEALADGRPEFDATILEWRSTPLWGTGARVRAGQRFLHDARAATPLEAILWHGGEAEAVKQRFINLNQSQRSALLAFLESL